MLASLCMFEDLLRPPLSLKCKTKLLRSVCIDTVIVPCQLLQHHDFGGSKTKHPCRRFTTILLRTSESVG